MTDELSPPVVLWDGECGFCRRWIDHWKDRVPDEVGFVPFQDVAGARLHEWGIDEVDLEEAMHFVDANGRTFRGAEAVFELLRGAEDLRYRVAAALYRHVEAFRLLADAAYRFVANRRVLAARVTRALWGQPQRSTYQFARWLFIRLLAVSAFVAFWSMWQQIDGLLGSNGILPAAEYMDRATAYAEQHALTTWERYEELPTLFWRSTSDAFLRGVCVSGMIGSGILFVGFVPRLVIPLLWFLYLSIMSVGQVFLGYQWDALLLEALLVGWFVAPWNPFPRVERPHRVSIAGRTLVWLLLFKLMFLSGWVKIRADEAWRSLQAMDYHFWTQPIPNAVAWYADRAPELVKSAAVAFTLFAELLVPFLIFAPRRFRHTGALTVIALQLGIGLTGTYGFFNILTIALCVLLFDDGFVEWATRGRFTVTGVASGNRWRLAAQTASVLVVGALVLLPMLGSLGFAKARVPDSLRSFRTFNSYGLFARMTRERPEIGVEVSRDGTTWTPLDFRWKPTRVDEPLRPTTFHMPRLDWQMWFAALGNCRQNVWFHAFLQRLMQGSAPVGRLLEDYDADRTPPAFVRTPFYRYEFGEGRWWTRRRTGTYCPTLTLNGDGNLAVAE